MLHVERDGRDDGFRQGSECSPQPGCESAAQEAVPPVTDDDLREDGGHGEVRVLVVLRLDQLTSGATIARYGESAIVSGR
ncbi:hypothetical protein UK12_19995 [Saccharothrix sp. ST-888]|nr:hypothetical protein UK12_19995 [Saccharothrix sp. ST-888]